jgi:opacity protein-like surface antigen
MRSLKLALLATAAVVALSSAAAAADLIVDVPIADPVIDNSFSFDGPFIGLFVQGQTGPAAFGVGFDVGYNVVMDNFLIGGEFDGAVLTGPVFDGQFTGKVGALISDNAVIYAYSGAGSKDFSSWYVPVGLGVEVGVADNVSIKGEAQYNFDLTSAAENSASARVGVNFHF